MSPVGVMLVEATIVVRPGATRLAFFFGRDQEVEGEEQVGGALADPVRRRVASLHETQVGDDGSRLLAESGLVEPHDLVAGGQCGGRDDLVDRDDAGPADPGHEDVGAGPLDAHIGGRGWLWQLPLGARTLPPTRVRDGDEARAVSCEAAVIGVAAGLVDAGLAPEVRVDRLYREAVALDPAVAAAFADLLVDDDPARTGRELPTLAKPPGVRRALLVVDEDGDALDLPQDALRFVEPLARPDHRVPRHLDPSIPLGLVGADDDPDHSLGQELAGEGRDRQAGLGVLCPGHGDRRVIEHLVGDVDAGRDRGLTASWPEWKKVPSPTFWKMWRCELQAACPIHWAPSPPIWVHPVIAESWRAETEASVWQPMPPPAIDPSGTTVDELCGQPEQKYGVRWTGSSPSRRRW